MFFESRAVGIVVVVDQASIAGNRALRINVTLARSRCSCSRDIVVFVEIVCLRDVVSHPREVVCMIP